MNQVQRITITLAACLCVAGLAAYAKPSVVKLIKTETGHKLTRNGKPYFIKGAGGSASLEALAKHGGNSTRTWGFDGNTKYLDEADKHGITVTSGLWLGHPQHGFNYGNAESINNLLKQAEKWIQTQKDHPALLIWAIGNEMEGNGNNPAIWYTINDIARLCKKLDPNHPTMTVIAELGGNKVKNIHRFCPDLDIVGINTYGGVASAGERYRKLGGTKPFIITEFGPPGQWETGKTAWGTPLEMNSTDKADWYLNGYNKCILGNPDLCLGSYAFTWGSKVEGSPTWFGLFLNSGEKTAPVESLAKAWGGPEPANLCPKTGNIKVSKQSGIKPGDTIKASVSVSDPDSDKLSIKWVLYTEMKDYSAGGLGASMLPSFPKSILKAGNGEAVIRLPGGGSYRLYAYAFDGKGNASYANIPLQGDGPPPALTLPKPKLPFCIYGDKAEGTPYIPSGYMGNSGAMKVQQNSTENAKSGKTCMKVSFTIGNEWGGVVWQNPPNDWGDRPGGYNLTGAKKVSFWARGEKGGETITFGVGIIGKGKKYYDSAKAEIKGIKLTNKWKQYFIPLEGKDLKTIKSGFYWSLAGQGKPFSFYLDDITYEQ